MSLTIWVSRDTQEAGGRIHFWWRQPTLAMNYEKDQGVPGEWHNTDPEHFIGDSEDESTEWIRKLLNFHYIDTNNKIPVIVAESKIAFVLSYGTVYRIVVEANVNVEGPHPS